MNAPNHKLPTIELTREEDHIDLREYLAVLLRNKWSIAGLGLLFSIVATLYANSLTPIYQASALLHIVPEVKNLVRVEEVGGLYDSNREYYETQYQILKSRALVEKVIEKLEIADFDSYKASQAANAGWDWRSLFGNLLPESDHPQDDVSLRRRYDEMLLGGFIRNLSVAPVRNSQLVTISFNSANPELAANVSNTLVNTYIENDLESRMSMTSKATDWLSERIDVLRQKLRDSELALQQYREQEKLVEVGGVNTLTAQQLSDLGGQVVVAEQRRAAAEASLRQINALSGESMERYASIPAVLNNSLVTTLKQAEAEAQRKVTTLSQRYGPKHPKLIQAKADLSEAKSNVERQIRSVISGVEKEFQVARQNELSIKRSLSSAKGEMQQINRKSHDLSVLEREVEANRNLYAQFLEKMKQSKETIDVDRARARMVDPAVPPITPVEPNKRKIILLALIGGLLFGGLVAFLKEHLDNTIKRATDIEEKLKLPLLGWLPHLKLKKKEGESPLSYAKSNSDSFFAESIRTLRTAVLLSGLDDPYKVIVVTSSVPGEGKSTISMSLADSLGDLHKVLLIDADMRRPTVGKTWGLAKESKGLSEYVAGEAKISESVHQTDNSNIYVMPSGIVPPNPLEMLSSNRFKDALDTLGKTFDHIIIDSAPTLAVSDALVLSSHASGVVYVVKADSTPYPTALDGLKRLSQFNAHLIGGVLNDVVPGSRDRYGRYGKYGDYRGYYGSYGYTSN